MTEAAVDVQRKKTSALKIICGIPGAIIIFVIALALYGASLGRGSFDGTNDKVYEAMLVYGATYSQHEADSGVDDIREQADVSESEAEQIAVRAVRAGLTPDKWGEFGSVAEKLAKLRRDGVID